MDKKYFAHSTDDAKDFNWQRLDDHLRKVGALAYDRGNRFGCGEIARVLGVLHDLGKYSEEFQRRLEGHPNKVNHATAGAVEAITTYGENIGMLLAYAVAGHHAGLANGRTPGTRTPLRDRLLADIPMLDEIWREEMVLPNIRPPDLALRKDRKIFQYAFLGRMLFSCLVDADYIETESFYADIDGAPRERGRRPALAVLKVEFDRYLEGLNQGRPVDEKRQHILQSVRGRADALPGHFSLTVPTGGGKTLTSLAFAIDHALKYGLDRVIYVIPFTSIVEQNAAVFREALGRHGADAVLEHHGSFDAETNPGLATATDETKAKLRRDSENWDAPIVVTTAVQFFESLFAAKTSRCRKLHNIANSVVILDEAQTIPLSVLRPSLAALDELQLNYRTSIVYCTATQPALTQDHRGALPEALTNVRELAPEPSKLFEQFKRVTIRRLGIRTDDEITQQLIESDQALCIVNNRRHARALFDSIADKSGARHLTTAMYAVHRRVVVADIRKRLKDGKPCRVIATSLIEAGVDIDFPLVLRAEAGLDALAQAAGRCNREGKRRSGESEVLVFATENPDWAPPPELAQFAQAMGEVLRNMPDADPLSPEIIARYFQTLYWQRGETDLDKHALLSTLAAKRIDDLPYEFLETEYRLIENSQRTVIVAIDNEPQRDLQALEYTDHIGGIARRLQPYTVQVPRQGFDALWRVGAIASVCPDRFGDEFVQLINHDLYDKRSGLSWSNPTYLKADGTVW